jgi:hypothetical protein
MYEPLFGIIVEATHSPDIGEVRALVRLTDGKIYCVYLPAMQDITRLIGEWVLASRLDRTIMCVTYAVEFRFREDCEYVVGYRYRHDTFGEGEVLAIEPSNKDFIVTVRFAESGTKRLLDRLAGMALIVDNRRV